MRIAVIGSGIAGVASAWLLSRPDSGGAAREVHLFEAEERLGGHTHTHTVPLSRGAVAGRTLQVDSGFIVFNEPTYPNLTRLFAELGVATQDSDMSFGLEERATGFCYAGSRQGMFPTARHLTDLTRVRLAAGILRFNRIASRHRLDPRSEGRTLGAFLKSERLEGPVADLYVVPMAAAIWSTGTGPVRDFPLKTFLDFFHNHGLLGVASHHPWRTVAGGSSSYIASLTAPYADRVHLGMAVRGITRDGTGVTVMMADGSADRFDHVVIAAHADDALAMLTDPDPQEKELLGAWEFSTNRAWLHTDTSLMPRERTAWASWNVRVGRASNPSPEVSLSYWMNRLQSLDTDTEFLVTLNPSRAPAHDKTVRRMTYTHPLFTSESVQTQRDLSTINGVRRTHFVGAWQRNGFHEDGLWSAVRMARGFGVDWGTV